MSKTKEATVEIQAQPSLFIEQVSTEKPPEFLAALKDYQRSVKNAQRSEQPLLYLTQQASYAWRIFSALKPEGITNLYVRQDNNGNFALIPASRAGFTAAYNAVVAALKTAQANGVCIANAEAVPRKDGSHYVKITAVGGVIGIA